VRRKNRALARWTRLAFAVRGAAAAHTAHASLYELCPSRTDLLGTRTASSCESGRRRQLTTAKQAKQGLDRV